MRLGGSLTGAALAAVVVGCAGQPPTQVVGGTPYGGHPYADAGGAAAGEVISGAWVPGGTRLVVQLDQPIGRDSRPGDRFTATVVRPLVDREGAAVVPVGSELRGRVTALESAPGPGQPATVALAVDSLRVGGVAHPIAGRIVGADVEATRHGVRSEYLLGGALGGALLGAIVGDTKGALIGGALGAGAGTLVSLGTAREAARLPRGTALAVELSTPLRVAALRGPHRARAGERRRIE